MTNYKNFSLIKVLIFITIIAFILAGITVKKELTESAKVKVFISELANYKTAVETFQKRKGRLPGDFNNDGTIELNSYEIYTKDSFPIPYNVKIPDELMPPFIDLYLEKLINFRVNPDTVDILSTAYLPKSKAFKKKEEQSYLFISGAFVSHVVTEDLDEKSRVVLHFSDLSKNNFKNPKIFKQLDEKIDDGDAFNGNLYSYCASASRGQEDMHYYDFSNYEKTISFDDGYCSSFNYNILH